MPRLSASGSKGCLAREQRGYGHIREPFGLTKNGIGSAHDSQPLRGGREARRDPAADLAHDRARRASTLEELQFAIQVAMGWTNSHLHQFKINDVSYGMADVDGAEDMESSRTNGSSG